MNKTNVKPGYIPGTNDMWGTSNTTYPTNHILWN